MMRRMRILIGAAVIALIVAAVLGVAYRRTLVVKSIEVSGVDEATAQQIRYMSGLQLGQSMFDVDERRIAINLRADGYIKLCAVDIEWPDAVRIEVQRRTCAARLEHLGFSYLVDGELSVLEIRNGRADLDVMLIKGAGMQQTPVGMPLNMEEDRRALAIELLGKVYSAGLGDIIIEMDMADLQNITLGARSGQTYLLGDGQDIAGKLALIAPVDAQLRAEGRAPGTVDITSGRFADYMPPTSTPAPTLQPGATASAQPAGFVPIATPAPAA